MCHLAAKTKIFNRLQNDWNKKENYSFHSESIYKFILLLMAFVDLQFNLKMQPVFDRISWGRLNLILRNLLWHFRPQFKVIQFGVVCAPGFMHFEVDTFASVRSCSWPSGRHLIYWPSQWVARLCNQIRTPFTRIFTNFAHWYLGESWKHPKLIKGLLLLHVICIIFIVVINTFVHTKDLHDALLI